MIQFDEHSFFRWVETTNYSKVVFQSTFFRGENVKLRGCTPWNIPQTLISTHTLGIWEFGIPESCGDEMGMPEGMVEGYVGVHQIPGRSVDLLM